MTRPAFEWERILSFAGAEINRPKLLAMGANFRRISHSIGFESKVPDYLRLRGAIILEDELKRTNNLTDWPCLSFRLLKDQRSPLSADMLSPNCTNEFVKCSVPMDIRGG